MKLLLFQIDGLSYQDFIWALEQNLVPKTKKWLAKNNYQINQYFTGLPTSTFAFQAKLFYNCGQGFPSYRFFDKKHRQPISASIGNQVKLMVENLQLKPRSIFEDLIVLEGIFSPGDKDHSLAVQNFPEGFSINSFFKRRPVKLKGPDWPFLFSLPVNTLINFIQISYFWLKTKRNLRIPFAWWYFWSQWFLFTVLMPYYYYYLRYLLWQSKQSIYFNCSGFDITAHAYSKRSRPVRQVLQNCDHALAKIIKLAKKKNYQPIIFSDHGMTNSRIFEEESGKRLKKWIGDFIGHEKGITIDEYPYPYTKRPNTDPLNSSADIYIANSGQISLIYFAKYDRRLTFNEIEKEFPKLISEIGDIRGIGVMAVKTEEGYWVGGKEGIGEFRGLPVGGGDFRVISGKNPLAKFGDLKFNQPAFLKWISDENQADITLLGDYNKDKDRVICFEDQVAQHGGFGGEQTQAFYCCPINFQKKFLKLIKES